MKRIATALVALLATLSTYAQKVEVYLNGEHIDTYYNTPKTNTDSYSSRLTTGRTSTDTTMWR